MDNVLIILITLVASAVLIVFAAAFIPAVTLFLDSVRAFIVKFYNCIKSK